MALNETPWSNLYAVNTYYAAIQNLQALGRNANDAENNLIMAIEGVFMNLMMADDACRDATAGDREIAAHTLSNATAPAFLLQHTSHWTASNGTW